MRVDWDWSKEEKEGGQRFFPKMMSENSGTLQTWYL